VHGGRVDVLEGAWQGNLIVIEFPDRERARAWYASAAYQEILHLRTDNSDGDVILVDGVPASHHATDVLAPTEGQSPAARQLRDPDVSQIDGGP